MTARSPNDMLYQLKAQYDEIGLISSVVEATGETPATLVILFAEIGQEHRNIHMELSFLPGLADADEAGLYFLQTFVTLAEEVPAAHYRELLSLAAKLNTTLPLGAFGLFEDTGVAYFKHNCMLQASNGDSANVKSIDIQSGLILHLHQLYFDGLLEVAIEGAPAASVLDKLPV
ncbi:hypothetical protein [Paenibacillus harenae]|uniref:Uncharacterized protein n=1 Tax=Paenibacillus harenae TaxID=306543 RepID=A0ABT9U1B8_PAEHA|nr:hypothetical protein [Paenibacillus harenae]MDQ0113430.1 hypothetical protein [Paenibacillus harenae]